MGITIFILQYCNIKWSYIYIVHRKECLIYAAAAKSLPDPGIKPRSPLAPALQEDSLLLSHQENPYNTTKWMLLFSLFKSLIQS